MTEREPIFEARPPAPDRLAIMLNMQSELQEKHFGARVEELTGQERIEFMKDMYIAFADEMHEVLGEIGWKPWAKTEHWNEEAVKGELIDAWHFFMNFMLVAGLDAESLFERYLKKHDVNIARQEAGYDGVSTKCSNCRRALDDEAVTCHVDYVDGSQYCCHQDWPAARA